MLKKLFITIETLIYISFISLDLIGKDSTYIKYIGILLCLFYALYTHNKNRIIAMLFTCLADLFLLVLNTHYELGVFIFIGAQITYLYYLGNIDKADFKGFLLIRALILAVGLLCLYLSKNVSILNILVLIYFSNLLINCVNAFKAKQTMFALGLLLFICCDICVGIHNINAANHLATLLMWVFYLPSQVLIVLS